MLLSLKTGFTAVLLPIYSSEDLAPLFPFGALVSLLFDPPFLPWPDPPFILKGIPQWPVHMCDRCHTALSDGVALQG
jgi:hypothetical protein